MGGCEANERKILVGVDEGDESMYALSWCLKNVVVPQNSKDTLVLLYAKKPRPVYPIIDGSTGYVLMPDVMETMDRYNNELAESRMEKAKKLCKEVHNLDVKVETRIESGDPRDVICQAAEKLSADVVVLGSHGYGLIKSMPEVRESAGLAFSTLYKSVGLQTSDEIVPTLLHALEDDETSDTALDGLKQILNVRTVAVLPHILPKLVHPPL